MGTTQQALERALQALAPSHLELVNESYMHSVPPGSESHFKAVLVSEELECGQAPPGGLSRARPAHAGDPCAGAAHLYIR